jgi:hypothetical protein
MANCKQKIKDKHLLYVPRLKSKSGVFVPLCCSIYDKTTFRFSAVLNLNLKRPCLYLRNTFMGVILLAYCRLTSDCTQRQSSNHFLLENQHQNYDGNNSYVYASCQIAPVYPVQRDELVQRHLKYHGIGFVRQYHR